ncbi:PqqD family protein [uncultured Bacteroides sp.]|uniref:PqqD family protein n=1 Tax=uncultured Bacteroides sp. TaxID=162156 RepID=UPI00260D9E06|nr:PqqD family protein [uncultured Bacteroides sp.]
MAGAEGKINLLDAVPIRGAHITTMWEGECAVLSYPRFKSDWIRRFLLPKSFPKDIRVTLEEHGTAVWSLIDGRRTVGEIVGLLAEHFRNEENYGHRVTAYILRLQKDGFVRLMVRR